MRALMIACTFGVSGCLQTGTGPAAALVQGGQLAALGNRVISQEVTLAGGFRVRAPKGYCIDQQVTARGISRQQVMLASCANLGGSDASGAFGPLALMSVAPARSPLGDLAALEAYYRSDQGRAALAASGQAADVTLQSVKRSRVALYINLRDQGLGAGGLSMDRWVGLVNVAGRSAVLSLTSADSAPMGASAGEALLRDLAQAVIDANGSAGRLSFLQTRPFADTATQINGEVFGRLLR